MNLPSTNLLASYGVAALFALLLHGVVAGLLMVNWQDSFARDLTDIQPYYIEAAIVSENPFKAREAREKLAEQAERQRLAQQQQALDSQMKKQQADWEKEKQALAEAHRLAAEQRRKAQLSEPSAPAPAASADDKDAKLRAELAANLAKAIAAEQGARKAVTDDEKAMAYVAQIQREIIQNWSRPPSARNGMQALLRVVLIPTGEVIDVQVEQSSGNSAFDRSALQAVRKSERFVVPDRLRQFERDFREFTVLFRPEDLRL